MIVDDELTSRTMIESVGRWQEFGIEIVARAADGRQAVKLLPKVNPDLLLLDMNMPTMNGAELLLAIEQAPSRPKVIVISGYEDFSYARVSLGYGAISYLLKPLDREELNRALQKFTEDMQREQTWKRGVESEQERVNAQLAYYILRGEKQAELEQLCLENGIIACRVCAFALPSADGVPACEVGRDSALRLLRLQPGYPIYLALDASAEGDAAPPGGLIGQLRRRIPDTALWGSCEQSDIPGELHDACKHSLTALNSRNLLDPDGGEPASVDTDHLKTSIYMGRFAEIGSTVERYIDACQRNRSLTTGEAVRFLDCLLSVVEAVWWNNGIVQEPPDAAGLLEEISFCFDPGAIFAAMRRLAGLCEAFLAANEASLRKDTLDLIQEYIHENLEANLSLRRIADRFFLTKEYLSRAFKAKYGCNLTDYIHEAKCTKAGALLQYHSVRSVAERLGYEDVSYFSRVYKKYKGVSPGSHHTEPT